MGKWDREAAHAYLRRRTWAANLVATAAGSAPVDSRVCGRGCMALGIKVQGQRLGDLVKALSRTDGHKNTPTVKRHKLGQHSNPLAVRTGANAPSCLMGVLPRVFVQRQLLPLLPLQKVPLPWLANCICTDL